MTPSRIQGCGPSVIAAWRFPAKDARSPHPHYDVALTSTGWECTCADHVFRDRQCRHIAACRGIWQVERKA